MRYKILTILIVFIQMESLGQNNSGFSSVLEALINYDVLGAQEQFNYLKKSNEKRALQWHKDILIKDSITSDYTDNKLLIEFPTLFHIQEAERLIKYSTNNDSLIFDHFKQGLTNALLKKDTTQIRFIYSRLLPFLMSNKANIDLLDNYTTSFHPFIKSKTDEVTYTYYKNIKTFYEDKRSMIPVYKESLLKLSTTNNRYLEGLIYQIIGTQKGAIERQADSAIFYFKKAALSFEKVHGVLGKKNAFAIYNNIAAAANINGNYHEALKYHQKAKKQGVPESNYLQKSYHYQSLAYTFRKLNIYDSAFFYLEKEKKEIAKLGEYTNAGKLQEIETKYQTAEKEKQILIEQAEKKRNRNISFGLGGTLLFGSVIAFLIYRNTKRKQHIAEQDRELQIQKTETILKEKELETINAMVSGQEKERVRLAGELHDNLGSTLVTVCMQIENLERNLDKVEDPKRILQKTNALVNEAYKKVRTISHERNSGVMAKDGLLPAIQKLARTISSNNNLQIEVQDFGLENRIANKLEITIFRIVQELVTNIVKHAHATEASISLTQHDNELNIMVEDNGKGFKVGKLNEKDGMGLGSIERRIEHLEGAMEVDSTPRRGTLINIDIPLQQVQNDI